MNTDYYQGMQSRVRELREVREIGVEEAKRIAKGERLLWLLEHLDDNRGVLIEVIKDLYGVTDA